MGTLLNYRNNWQRARMKRDRIQAIQDGLIEVFPVIQQRPLFASVSYLRNFAKGSIVLSRKYDYLEYSNQNSATSRVSPPGRGGNRDALMALRPERSSDGIPLDCLMASLAMEPSRRMVN